MYSDMLPNGEEDKAKRTGGTLRRGEYSFKALAGTKSTL